MPVKKGASDKVRQENIKQLMSEVGKSPHVQSRKQAVAIAYSQQRQARKKQQR